MSLHHLRRRVDALRRKLAPELAVIRLRRLAEEFCDQWAVADHQEAAQPHPFIKRVADAGFRLPTFMALHKYLERCRNANEHPQPRQIVGTLLPWAASGGFLVTFQWELSPQA